MKFDSPIEELFAAALWAELARRPVPISVQLQAPHGPYRLDFLLRVDLRVVAVECDGHDFHERTADQAERDRRRDRYLTAEGIPFLRFTGRELYRDATKCAREALQLLGVPASTRSTKREQLARKPWRSAR